MHDSVEDHKLKSNNPKNLFHGRPIVSDQITREGLEVVWNELDQILQSGVPGDVVEFGCYIGTTSVYIRQLLNAHSSKAAFHVYDSFDGLPKKNLQDENAAGVDFSEGKLYAPKKEFIKTFRSANLQLPIIHKGWFNEITEKEVPEEIAFAFLDGDFYDSILDSLRLVWPHLNENGTLLIDDFNRETLPGVERAVQDYFGGTLPVMRIEHNIAVIHKASQMGG